MTTEPETKATSATKHKTLAPIYPQAAELLAVMEMIEATCVYRPRKARASATVAAAEKWTHHVGVGSAATI